MPPQDPANPETLSIDLPEDMLKANPELQELMDLLKDLEDSFQLQPTQTTQPPDPPPTEQIEAEEIPAPITAPEEAIETENPLSPCLAELNPTEFVLASPEQTEEKKIAHQTKLKRRTIGISLLSLCTVMIYLFFNFEALSRDPHWHPTIASLCAVLSCDAPLPVDISQIKSSKLVLHPDVKHKNKLLLDAVIYNQAAFAQPFPDIELRLTDHYQQPIAQHRFHPMDYRQGQLLNISAMPSQQPIHITLSIPNPNISILNYELKFYSSLQSGLKRYHTTHVPSGN